MDIAQLAAASGDSQLLSYCYSNGVLRLRMHVPDVSDGVVVIDVPTRCVFAAVPQAASEPHRTCFIELQNVVSQAQCNESGIVIPPADFGTMMRQLREGLGMVYGSRVAESPYLFRLVAARPWLICPVADLDEIRVQVETQASR